MIGRTLFAYFFRRFLWIVLFFLAGVAVLAFMLDFMDVARLYGSASNYTLPRALMLSLLRLPSILQDVVPFAVLFGGMTTLIVLNRRYELVVARSAGISAWQFLAPLCAASFLVGGLMVTLLNPAAADALSRSREIYATMRGLQIDETEGDAVPWLTDHTQQGVLLIGARNTARQGLLLIRATFVQLDAAGNIAERLDARSALFNDGKWNLHDVVRTSGTAEPRKLDEVEISSGLDPQLIRQRFADPKEISIYQLVAAIRSAHASGLGADAFETRFQLLVALPFLLMAMTLVAATVSMRFIRVSQPASMVVAGTVAGFALFVASSVSGSLGALGLLPPFVAAWFPVAAAGLFGATFMLFREDG